MDNGYGSYQLIDRANEESRLGTGFYRLYFRYLSTKSYHNMRSKLESIAWALGEIGGGNRIYTFFIVENVEAGNIDFV